MWVICWVVGGLVCADGGGGIVPHVKSWKAPSGMRALDASLACTFCPGSKGWPERGRQITRLCTSVPLTLHRHRGPVLEHVGALRAASGWMFRHSHSVGLRANVGSVSISEASMQWSAVNMCQPGRRSVACTKGSSRKRFETGFSTETAVPPLWGWHVCSVCNTVCNMSWSLMAVGEWGWPPR